MSVEIRETSTDRYHVVNEKDDIIGSVDKHTFTNRSPFWTGSPRGRLRQKKRFATRKAAVDWVAERAFAKTREVVE